MVTHAFPGAGLSKHLAYFLLFLGGAATTAAPGRDSTMAKILDFDAARTRLAIRTADARGDLLAVFEAVLGRCVSLARGADVEAVVDLAHEIRVSYRVGSPIDADLAALQALHARLEAEREASAPTPRAPWRTRGCQCWRPLQSRAQA